LKKILLLVLLSIGILSGQETFMKIKTNPTSILIGMLNIKAEVKILEKLSIEPTITFTRYKSDFDILAGANMYLYLNSVMKKKGYFASAGLSKGVKYKDEFYSGTIGYQWYNNSDTSIRYTSIEFGAMYKKDLDENDDMLLPVIYFNISF